jgi:hypothetical protein
MDVARFSGAVAIDDDVLVRRDPLRGIPITQLREALPYVAEAFLGEIVLPVVADGTGNVPSPHLSPRLAGVLIRRPGVDQGRIAGGDGAPHVLEGRLLGVKGAGGKPGRGESRVLGNQSPLFQLPFEVAAVQHVHLGMAKPSQQPGQKGRINVTGLPGAINDDRLIDAQPEPAKELGIGSGRKELRGDATSACTKGFSAEVHGTGQVILQVGKQVCSHIHDAHRTLSLPSGKLFCGYQPRQCFFHCGRGLHPRRGAACAAGPEISQHEPRNDGQRPHRTESSPMYTLSSSRYTLTAFRRRRELSETGRVASAGGSDASARPIGRPSSMADFISRRSPMM